MYEPETSATGLMTAQEEKPRKLAIICSKGSLDMAYPGLILANAARMMGVEAVLFFTFWGMDIITKKKSAHLHAGIVGNPSMPMPTMVAGLPGMEAMATAMMKKQMEKLDIPSIPEMLELLEASGAELYACKMAADMFGLTKEDFVPEVKEVITAMDFIEKSDGAQVIFI